MTRFTPRTCLYPLTGCLLATFALSVGLTYRSDHHCYAGVCGEWLFPLQARLHVVVWYLSISISVTFLAVRAFAPDMQRLLRTPLASGKIPIVGKSPAISGALTFAWILVLYGVVVGIWWIRLRDYFADRGVQGGVVHGNAKLAATALTGHLADITMGMVLLPISRHSALASFFKLSVSTILTFHMLTAYTLFVLVLIHAFLYISWVPVFHALSANLRHVYPVLNPTYLYAETWPGNTSSLGIWRASLIFTGLLTALIFCLIFITTLPPVRAQHFNVFYFTHLLSIVAVIIVCLHASTLFYCLAPGIAMWLLDWGMRIFELRRKLNGKVTSVGNGWYCLSVPLPRHRLNGCACTSPLAHFYLHHSDSSMRELHPFTTITHLASQNAITPRSEDDFSIGFLFRKQGAPGVPAGTNGSPSGIFGTSKRKGPKTQWTTKVAGLVEGVHPPTTTTPGIDGEKDVEMSRRPSIPASSAGHQTPFEQIGLDQSFPMADIPLRLEGPYFTPADPARYNIVVCFVAGTGVSGAIAIAGAFAEMERGRAESADCCTGTEDGGGGGSCTHCGTGSGPGGSAIRSAGRGRGGGKGGPCTLPSDPKRKKWEKCVIVWSVRADQYVDLPFFKVNPASALEVRVHLTGKDRPRLDFDETLSSIRGGPASRASTWVYLSGPNAFIEAGEKACKDAVGVEWNGAKWDI